MADSTPVYNTTVQLSESKKCFFGPTIHLNKHRCFVKLSEVVLSFLAFVLEEVVTNCSSCMSLYLFEFVSCTAFLFTFLLLVLLTTKLHEKVGINCWPKLDFFYTVSIGLIFFIASITFASDNAGSSLEVTAVVFGFLATGAFATDTALFVKTNGLPFRRQSSAANNAAPNAPETEKLRDGNGLN